MRLSLFIPIAVAGLFAGLGCDTTVKGRDAAAGQSPQPAQVHLAEMTIRLDAPNDGAPSVSVLAYRAAVTGAEDVRSVVDPLMAPAPEGVCVLRDVAGPARALGARGGTVELDALSHLAVELGNGQPDLRVAPRVYPDLASVVGGVVGEAAPVALVAAPASVTITDGANGREVVGLPELPRLLDADGAALPASASFPAKNDLVLSVPGPLAAFVELRPFGATWALACPVDSARQVVIPAAEIARLMQRSGRVPVSVEAVARDERALALAGSQVRLTLEARSSSVVELRP
jgi:hypothetical protein